MSQTSEKVKQTSTEKSPKSTTKSTKTITFGHNVTRKQWSSLKNVCFGANKKNFKKGSRRTENKFRAKSVQEIVTAVKHKRNNETMTAEQYRAKVIRDQRKVSSQTSVRTNIRAARIQSFNK